MNQRLYCESDHKHLPQGCFYFIFYQISLDCRQQTSPTVQFSLKFCRLCVRSGSCSETFKNTTAHWPEEGEDRSTDFRGGGEPRRLTAAIQMLWNEYKYNNYMTENSSTMLYASYTILLGRLRTCRVGLEKVNGVCLVSVCPLSLVSTSVHCNRFVQQSCSQ